MNDSILARGGADSEPRCLLRCLLSRRAFIVSLSALPAIPAAAHVASASPALARGLRVGGVFLLTLVLALAFAAISAAQAEADSRIRAGSCDIYAINRVDPIAFASHDHEQFGNPTLTNSSTGGSLKSANRTTCSSPNGEWMTSAGWFPTPQQFDADKATVYYRDPGDIDVKPIPTGLKL